MAIAWLYLLEKFKMLAYSYMKWYIPVVYSQSCLDSGINQLIFAQNG